MTARLVVLASGHGSNLQAVLDACTSGALAAQVVGVSGDRPDAYALQRAHSVGIPAVAVPRLDGEERRAYDRRLAAVVAQWEPDWVVLAGFMRLLTSEFLDRFPHRVLNVHPALPGELPGVRAIERAFDEWQAGHRSQTGVMVHLVPDEGVDSGPVIMSETVDIGPHDTLTDLEQRMHAVEHRLLVAAIALLIDER
jgi:phosphoribosylglycinamide formyltransferase-1